MEQLSPQLRSMYLQDRKQLPDDTELSGLITYTDTLSGYYFLVDFFTQPGSGESMLPGLRDPGLLASALSRQTASFGGQRKWSDPIDAAASLFFGLVKNHAFHDGNKRISLLMLLHSLRRNGRWVNSRQKDFEALTVSVAGSTLSEDFPRDFAWFAEKEDPEVRFISHFVKRRTRWIDEEFRSITFRELKRILNSYSFDIDEPDGNKISIFERKEGRKWLGFGPKTVVVTRLGTVGFPSWTKQVSRKDLRKVRELTGLVAENGVDSTAFYQGNETMFKLISEFEGPLRRLKDK